MPVRSFCIPTERWKARTIRAATAGRRAAEPASRFALARRLHTEMSTPVRGALTAAGNTAARLRTQAGIRMKRVALVVLGAAVMLGMPAEARVEPPLGKKTNAEIVVFEDEYARGTIVVRTAERTLYYVLGDGEAIRYPVAVGEPRFQWS